MGKKFSLLFTLLLFAGCSSTSSSTTPTPTPVSVFNPNEIPWTQAVNYIGSTKTVCGKIVHMGDDISEEGSGAIWLDMGARYPDKNRISIVFWPEYQKAFGYEANINELYMAENICITGFIESFDGVPQIEATTPKQIEIRQSVFP